MIIKIKHTKLCGVKQSSSENLFIALKPNIRLKRQRFHFQKLEKEEQRKPKVNNRTEAIKRKT